MEDIITLKPAYLPMYQFGKYKLIETSEICGDVWYKVAPVKDYGKNQTLWIESKCFFDFSRCPGCNVLFSLTGKEEFSAKASGSSPEESPRPICPTCAKRAQELFNIVPE